MVRIQDSQSWHRGSIPLSTTKETFKKILCKSVICRGFFFSKALWSAIFHRICAAKSMTAHLFRYLGQLLCYCLKKHILGTFIQAKQDLKIDIKSCLYWDGVFIEVRIFCPCGQVAGDQAAILFPVYLCHSSNSSSLEYRVRYIRSVSL